MNIGAKIRELRTGKNMSLKDLAESTNCTPSFISQIERDIANPSINTLKKISEKLNVPLVDFFEEPEAKKFNYIVKKNERVKFTSSTENSEVYLLTPSHVKKNIEMHMIVIEPGGKSDRLYVNNTEEVGYIVKGKLTLLFGEERYEVEEGDSIYFPGDVPHGWLNESDSQAITIWATTPPIIE